MKGKMSYGKGGHYNSGKPMTPMKAKSGETAKTDPKSSPSTTAPGKVTASYHNK